MKASYPVALQPRKKPVQARAAFTVEALAEATIQVLLTVGLDRLTTNHVAKRAGVSVGTLYQYYPNKLSLLSALLEEHMEKVADAVEVACVNAEGKPLAEMVDVIVQRFLDAKLKRTDISVALYKISGQVGGPVIVERTTKRCRKALGNLIKTASDIALPPDKFAVEMLFAAMSGATRSVLEAGATSVLVANLRKHLVLLCQSYMVAATGGCSVDARDPSVDKLLFPSAR